jgi:Xaa-Pro aminopeptidase
MVAAFPSSLNRLQSALASDGSCDALLVTDITNIQWLSEFTGSSAVVVVSADQAVFITDSRYTIQAKEQVQGFEIRTFQSPMTTELALAQTFADLGHTRIGFEDSLTLARFARLRTKIPGIEWVETKDHLRPLRMVKSAAEIARIQEVCRLADACLQHVQRMLLPGVSELDVSLDIEFFMRRQGAVVSFDPIVASGPNSARPHARASDRIFERGDFVTLDLGAKLDGYCSDITRTFVIGEASDWHREVYEQVLRAEVECCALLRPGASGSAIDAHARAVLDEKGLAQYFGHGLGHGLGRDVHDFGSLSTSSTDVMEAGMVFTVEPGVYVEGRGGLRIEDDVLVTDGDPIILTSFPKDLMILG